MISCSRCSFPSGSRRYETMCRMERLNTLRLASVLGIALATAWASIAVTVTVPSACSEGRNWIAHDYYWFTGLTTKAAAVAAGRL